MYKFQPKLSTPHIRTTCMLPSSPPLSPLLPTAKKTPGSGPPFAHPDPRTALRRRRRRGARRKIRGVIANCRYVYARWCSGTKIANTEVWRPCSGTCALFSAARCGVPEHKRARYCLCSSPETGWLWALERYDGHCSALLRTSIQP